MPKYIKYYVNVGQLKKNNIMGWFLHYKHFFLN